MKDYYDILGIRRGAALPEIKQSFRRLANKYHPDRNPSKEAESIIKEVIEAYQVLEDPIQRALYDSLLTKDEPASPVMNRSGRPHRDPRYRHRSRNPNYKSEKQQMRELMIEWMPWSVFVSRCTLIVCLVLSFDITLPPRTEKETIKGRKYTSFRSFTDSRIVTQRGNEFVVSPAQASLFAGGASVTIAYSPWMRIPLYLVRDDSGPRIRIAATIYGNFLFVPVVLMITSLLGVFWKKNIAFRFNCGVVNALLFLLTVVFLFIHHLKIT